MPNLRSDNSGYEVPLPSVVSPKLSLRATSHIPKLLYEIARIYQNKQAVYPFSMCIIVKTLGMKINEYKIRNDG